MNDFCRIKKCPVCSKKFGVFSVEQYGWKFGTKLFCSYTCMRKVERAYLEYANREKNVQPERKILPEEFIEVYTDLMVLRSWCRKYDHLRRKRYKDEEEIDFDLLNNCIEKCLRNINHIKSKYAQAVSKLSKPMYDLLTAYILDFNDRKKLQKKFNMSYEDICDMFLEILGVLDENKAINSTRVRWVCGS